MNYILRIIVFIGLMFFTIAYCQDSTMANIESVDVGMNNDSIKLTQFETENFKSTC